MQLESLKHFFILSFLDRNVDVDEEKSIKRASTTSIITRWHWSYMNVCLYLLQTDGRCYDTAAGSCVLKDNSVDICPLGNEHGVICTRPHGSARGRAL